MCNFRFSVPFLTVALLTTALLCSQASNARVVDVSPQSQYSLAFQGRQPLLKQGGASSAAEAAQIAKQRYGGKILSVSEKKTETGTNYYVKLLLDDGRVKTVVIKGA